jgi:hypothetical protein
LVGRAGFINVSLALFGAVVQHVIRFVGYVRESGVHVKNGMEAVCNTSAAATSTKAAISRILTMLMRFWNSSGHMRAGSFESKQVGRSQAAANSLAVYDSTSTGLQRHIRWGEMGGQNPFRAELDIATPRDSLFACVYTYTDKV